MTIKDLTNMGFHETFSSSPYIPASKDFLESLPVAIYTTDADGYITSYNKAAALLWGREPELGRDRWSGSWKIYNLDETPLPLEDSPTAVAIREKRSINGQQIIIQRPDGSRSYVKSHPNPIIDAAGDIKGAVNMLIDYTDIRMSELTLEKKIEERAAEIIRKNSELIRSEERYHKMIEEVEDYAIILMDKNGIILNWNKGAEKIKGYKEQEIIGENFRRFYLKDDQEKNLPEQLILLASTTGKAIHEGWRVRKDGSTFWGSIVITALHDQEGNILGFSKVTRDLTERKNAEDKIKQYTYELEAQNKELQQFAYAAAHDMKEPLRKVSFYTSSVLENTAATLSDKDNKYLTLAIEATKRMQGLIEDLLAYTKSSISYGAFEPVNLNEIVAETKNSHHEIIEQIHARVIVGPLPTIIGIPFQIRQLIDNLIGNALKYHHTARLPEIHISAERTSTPPYPELSNSLYRQFHKITIKDNGIGFDQKHAEKIFEMFERLHGREQYPGTGIGLALCKKIAQNHKGWIYASGIPDGGSEFAIYIPANADY
jgi:PAS domain S-box-containing protein